MANRGAGKKIAVILFGPPGSGKGTQAFFLSQSEGLEHIDSGRIIEQTVHNPELQKDEIIKRERENFDSGRLNTPSWVAEIILNKARECAKNGGVVFSGSPRTVYEAEKFLPELENLFGGKNVFFFRLNVAPETSVFRNSRRRICRQCGVPVVYSEESEKKSFCSVCGGELAVRVLDEPEKIKVRLAEYENRTKPIFSFVSERGYGVIDIDGEQKPQKVFSDIRERLEAVYKPQS